MTPSELKACVEEAGHEPFFFSRDTMKFFGDSMKNYGVRAKPVKVEAWTGEFMCWELYRKQPVKYGLCESAYFDVNTFQRVFPKK